jgi:predicted transposase/invertase (TIGR01784 family)
LSNQLRSGDRYAHLKPVVGITLLAGDMYPQHPEQACWRFALRDEQQPGVRLGPAMEMHIIELAKAERLRGLPPALSDWIICLLHSPRESIVNKITHPPALEAMQHLETLLTDEQLMHQAFYREMALVEGDFLRRKAEEMGLKRGIEQGIELGLEQGIEQGIPKGKATLLIR